MDFLGPRFGKTKKIVVMGEVISSPGYIELRIAAVHAVIIL